MRKILKFSFASLLALVGSVMCMTASASKPKPHLGEPIVIKGGTPRPRSVLSIFTYYYNGYEYVIDDNSIFSINATVTCQDDTIHCNDFTYGNIFSIETSTDLGTYFLEPTLYDVLYYYGDYIIE